MSLRCGREGSNESHFATAEMVIHVNRGPQGGSCSLSEGEENSLILECERWIDKDGVKEYQFFGEILLGFHFHLTNNYIDIFFHIFSRVFL